MKSGLRKNEEGSLLIILMIGVAVSTIALSTAMQSWSVTWRRDSEDELIFRGNQYVDAILAYRKEHGGQFPTNLEDLAEPGPRRVRYIRQLYREPISRDGRWGLLYLMPGGQGVFDPGATEGQAAAIAGANAAQTALTQGGLAGGALTGGAGARTPPGFAPLNTDPNRTGIQGSTGLTPGSVPFGTPPVSLRPAGGSGSWDSDNSDAVSESPLGWPIVGVVSRATGRRAEETYKIYKGHTQVNAWQFHVFDRGIQLQQAPAGAAAQQGGQSGGAVGPGFGGRTKVRSKLKQLPGQRGGGFGMGGGMQTRGRMNGQYPINPSKPTGTGDQPGQ